MTLLIKNLFAFLLIVFLLISCERETIKTPIEAMRLAESPPELFDDLPLSDLEAAIADRVVKNAKLGQGNRPAGADFI